MIRWKYVIPVVARRLMPQSFLYTVMKFRGDGALSETFPARYYEEWWRDQLEHRGLDLKGKRVLEIGSGRYARFALQWLNAGAHHVTLIDLYATSLDESAHHAMLAADCAALGLNFDNALSRIQVIQGDVTTLSLPESFQLFDVALSSAVLEHVRDPQAVLMACWNWLKPGGETYHMIDLRDHNLAFHYPFEMLTFSEKTWNRWLDLQGGFHLNRWRVPDYMRAMRAAGFVQIEYETRLRDDDGLKAILPHLRPEFRSVDSESSAVLLMYLYGRKPSG